MSRPAPRSVHRVRTRLVASVAALGAVATGALVAPQLSSADAALTVVAQNSFDNPASTPDAFSASSQVTLTKSTTAQSGSYYARVMSSSSSAVPVGIKGATATGLAAGTNLVASCYVRTSWYYSAILRVAETSGGQTLTPQEKMSATTQNWALISVPYTVSGANASVTVSAYSVGPTTANGGALAVDSCTISQSATAPVVPTLTAPTMPATAPSGFTRAFTEDFNTPAAPGSFDSVYGSKFAEYSGCCSTNKTTVYSSSKVLSASNGSMVYNLHSENGTSYSAAPVPGKYMNFTYGQVGMSIRLASSVGTGYKMAMLLWPQTDEWTNEVDFPEVYPDFSQPMYAASVRTTTDNGVHNFVGGPSANSGISLSDNQYHTFLLDWRPGLMTATIDGKTVGTFTGDAVPAQAMHFVMQTEGWIDHGPVPSDSSAKIEVPWVYINTRN